MSSDFEQDRERVLTDIAAARSDLLRLIDTLSADDLDIARRGSWSVRSVIQHIVLGEWGHTRGILRLLGADDPLIPDAPPLVTSDEVFDALFDSRAAHLSSVDGIEEDDFYRLASPSGGQEWSVMSFLEGTADHDREHHAQIEALLDR
jgi:hypothetical protein